MSLQEVVEASTRRILEHKPGALAGKGKTPLSVATPGLSASNGSAAIVFGRGRAGTVG